jgi:poly(3-hydroxybutyrate) depolymerase
VLAQRRYRLFMPAGVSASRPAPLLVLLHGCGQDAASFAACTRVAALARAQRCVVLMPEQSQRANAHRCWNWFHSAPQVAAEARTLMAIVDQVCRMRPIRMDQVYVFGLSAGGAMALTLALHYPDRFAAAASHSGATPHLARNASQAARVMRGHAGAHSPAEIEALSLYLAGRRPPPVLLLHGDADRVVAFDNAIASASLWQALVAPDAPAVTAPRSIQRGSRRACTVFDWCLDGKPYVRMVRVQGLGHAWSGGASGQAYADPQGPDALRMAFAFFAQATAAGAGLIPARRLRAA